LKKYQVVSMSLWTAAVW